MKDLEKRVSIIEDKLGIVNGTPKLEVGKWYKVIKQNGGKPLLALFSGTETRSNCGFDFLGRWQEDLTLYNSCLGDDTFKATAKEVVEALINEAKRRYNNGDKVSLIDGNLGGNHGNEIYLKDFSYESGNQLYCDGNLLIFDDGVWAEVIEQQYDKFAELKEADRNGCVIECRANKAGSQWVLKTHEMFVDCFEYRIKPEEKQKTKFHELAYELGITEDYKVDKFVEALTKLSYESGLTLEQDIQQLKEKYKQYKFTITIEDNI